MRLQKLITNLERYYALHGDIEVGMVGGVGSPAAGVNDTALAEVATSDGGVHVVAIISATKFDCPGCSLCRAGKPH